LLRADRQGKHVFRFQLGDELSGRAELGLDAEDDDVGINFVKE
jgi:hypothetical protein